MQYVRMESETPCGLHVLCYLIFLGTLEWGVVIPTLWPLLQSQGAPETFFGIVIGTFSLTRVICQPLVGVLGDSYSLKGLLSCCVFINTVGGVLYALAPTPWALLLARVVCGVGASGTPLLFAWIARALPKEQGVSAQVRLQTARALGSFIGPFASITLRWFPERGIASQLNSAGWIIAATNLSGLVCLLLFVSDPAIYERHEGASTTCGARRRPSVWRSPVVWLCLFFQADTALLLAVIEVVPPLVIAGQFDLPPTATSLLFGFGCLGVLISFGVVQQLSKLLTCRTLMLIGIGITTLGVGLAWSSWTPGGSFFGFVVAWMIIAIPPAPFVRTPSRALYTSAVPGDAQGMMQGVTEAVFSFANFLGPVIGSAVVESGGTTGVLRLIAGIQCVSILLFFVGFKHLGAKVSTTDLFSSPDSRS
mmetsp:Transcript_103670/g.187051  ORF Transcript_103670/g.187051 Transcript_103670/m.187051 type:complete len:422 (+) Transcript_103670:47-1312(+)